MVLRRPIECTRLFVQVESHPLEISKHKRVSRQLHGSSAANFRKAHFRGLHTYRLSVISEKKKAKEPMSKLSFRLPSSHHAQPSPASAPLFIGSWRRAKAYLGKNRRLSRRQPRAPR